MSSKETKLESVVLNKSAGDRAIAMTRFWEWCECLLILRIRLRLHALSYSRLKFGGATLCSFEVHNSMTRGYHLVATSDIPAGSAIFHVPHQLILTYASALQSPIGQAISARCNIRPTIALLECISNQKNSTRLNAVSQRSVLIVYLISQRFGVALRALITRITANKVCRLLSSRAESTYFRALCANPPGQHSRGIFIQTEFRYCTRTNAIYKCFFVLGI